MEEPELNTSRRVNDAENIELSLSLLSARRYSEGHFNYIDRVRVQDGNRYSGPGRGCGWRPRSLSSIDLSSNSSRSRDFGGGLYDLYSPVDSGRDYEDFYVVNHKVNRKNNSVYDQIDKKDPEPSLGNTACSLRRTRSLAVIREETFNDLQVSRIKSRRSQLIPRAKLVEQTVFQEKYRKKNSDEDSNSGNTQSTQESTEFYANLKRLDTTSTIVHASPVKRHHRRPNSWQNEKSDDLDSLDSSYFRNSSHQVSIEPNIDPDFNSNTNSKSGQERLAESTTSNSDDCQELTQKEEQAKHRNHNNKQIGDSESLFEIKLLDEVLKSEDQRTYQIQEHAPPVLNHRPDVKEVKPKIDQDISKLVIKLDENVNEIHIQNGVSEISELAKYREDIKSVVSYDSIYLSSEVTSDQEENLYSNPDTNIVNVIQLEKECSLTNDYDDLISCIDSKPYLEEEEHPSLDDIYYGNNKKDNYLNDHSEHCLDKLYSQVKKTKPKIVAIEPKAQSVTNLSSFSNITNRGTLERLSFLASNRVLNDDYISQQPHKESPPDRYVKKISKHSSHRYTNKDHHSHTPVDSNHYYSLPDINIGKILSASEKIDAKLRLSCEVEKEQDEEQVEKENEIYETSSHFGKQHRRIRQREDYSTVFPEPIAIEELPREAPSIEVETPIKEIHDKNQQYKEELDSFSGSEQDCSLNPFTVSIGGKQVIVDEVDRLHVDKLNLKRVKEQVTSVKRSNSLRDSQILKESIEARNSEIKAYTPQLSDDTEPGKTVPQILNKQESTETPPKKEDIKAINVHTNRIPEKQKPPRFNKAEKKEEIPKKFQNNKKSIQPVEKSLPSKQSPVTVKEMPRPQILQIVDSSAKKIPTKTVSLENIMENVSKEIISEEMELSEAKKRMEEEDSQQEFHDKVDSIRCYWTKLAVVSPDITDENEPRESVSITGKSNSDSGIDQLDGEIPQNNIVEEIVKSIETENVKVNGKSSKNAANFLKHLNKPTVEIVEFDDKTQTAVVKARSADNVFDHVRYKVMKSDTFQKNLLSHKHKEAQFDGLMQYLQDYSFQELLANNNVVIIEPVRTKIEKISEKPVLNQRASCKITGGAGNKLQLLQTDSKNALKRHFFYHPVRVNKELIDEELPTPDTVRNVRKLFESSLRLRSASKDNISTNTSTTAIRTALANNGRGSGGIGVEVGNQQPTNRNKTGHQLPHYNRNCQHHQHHPQQMKCLAIDTNSSTNPEDATPTHINCNEIRKWDCASLSSGVSSGEMSSPCDCTDATKYGGFSSEENLCDENICDTNYVSQDVLEKIRERGSSVTYYGGRVLDKRMTHKPITKAIIQEINETSCGTCQPFNCPRTDELSEKFNGSEHCPNYLGVKFKLVKSNSCSSRLELVGTGKINSVMSSCNPAFNQQQIHHQNHNQQRQSHPMSSPSKNKSPTIIKDNSTVSDQKSALKEEGDGEGLGEKCVRSIVEQLETNKIQQKPIPRIIESKCIEKITADVKMKPVDITVNNQIVGANPLPATEHHIVDNKMPSNPVTVNNHINFYETNKINGNPPENEVGEKHTTKETTTADKNTNRKVCRNRNVDLAFSIINNTNNNNSTNTFKQETKKEKPKESQKITFKSVKESIQEQPEPVITSFLLQIQKSDQKPVDKTNKIGKGDSDPEPEKEKNRNSDSVLLRRFSDNLRINAENNKDEDNSGQNLIKWTSLNKFDEKFYVTNDVKLKHKKKYDEMEFEEFEIYDPNNECYDSLNSNK